MQMHRILVFVAALGCCATSFEVKKYSLYMPNARVTMDDQYLCTAIRVDYQKPYYLTAFEPNSTKEVAHHVAVLSCSEPGSKSSTWNCGSRENTPPGEEYALPCAKDPEIIYVWALDAPKLELPEGVGFKIGGDTSRQYLILQVHYLNGHQDHAGGSSVTLHYTQRPQDKLAGVFFLESRGEIPPHKMQIMEASCSFKGPQTIYPFAFRTHTHGLGKLVEGYKVEQDEEGNSHWTLLGRKDPQLPQMFYPIATNEPIKKGDTLAARCIMESDRAMVTHSGLTYKDEMCVFYIMYYVKGKKTLNTKFCLTSSPHDQWNITGINNIPSYEP